jgi:ABC-type antimicrobial peptide transport system permease subunit
MVGCDSARAAVVVGVVRNSAIRSVGERDQPHLYRPFAREYAGGLTTILLRTGGDPAGMVGPVRRSLLAMGRGIRVYTVQPLATHVDQSHAQLRWQAGVMTLLGMLALLLAAVGLYGAIAYRVALRTRELGVRMALGATRGDVFRDVLGRGLAIVLLGVVIGEVLTAAITRVLGSMLEGIAATALATHLAIALVWIVVALAACYLPALRAARMDPLAALRHE